MKNSSLFLLNKIELPVLFGALSAIKGRIIRIIQISKSDQAIRKVNDKY